MDIISEFGHTFLDVFTSYIYNENICEIFLGFITACVFTKNIFVM